MEELYGVQAVDGTKWSPHVTNFFPDWHKHGETIVYLGPHDDDPLLGCAIGMQALKRKGAEVYAVIVTDGSKGYCRHEQCHHIVPIRKDETRKAYDLLGIDEKHVIRLDYPDMDARQCMHFESMNQPAGIKRLMKLFREMNATRVFVPNYNDFHPDHKATFEGGTIAGIQADSGIIPELSENGTEKTFIGSSYFQYPVWMDFDGDATHALIGMEDDFKRKLESIGKFISQVQIEQIVNDVGTRGNIEFYQQWVPRMFGRGERHKTRFGRRY